MSNVFLLYIRARGLRISLPPEDVEKIRDLRAQGSSYATISKMTGYSRWTVAKTLGYRVPAGDVHGLATYVDDERKQAHAEAQQGPGGFMDNDE